MSDIPDLERLRFFAGELLTADDLTAMDGNQRALRWLHNRTLHPWGIGFGLDVIGARGATSVTVNPGYAIDAHGREILLPLPLQLPIPAVPGGPNGTSAAYYLVANYVQDADEPTEEQRGGTACTPGGAVRLSNAPAIVWKTQNQLDSGVDVVLGQASIRNCVLFAQVSAAARRYATPCADNGLAAGEVLARDLVWLPWRSSGVHIGFTAAIDTSAANFAAVPRYMVEVIGSRSLTSPALIVADFVSIADDAPNGFTLQVAFPPMSGPINPPGITNPFEGPKLLAMLDWRIAWMGVGA